MLNVRFVIFIPAFLIFTLEVCAQADESVNCTHCHKVQASQHEQSSHKSFQCQQCHQGKDSYQVTAQTLQTYSNTSLSDPRPTFDHGTSFTGKPSRKDIPQFCGNCHAEVERMNPIGLRTDQLARYWTSRHGLALKIDGNDRAAVCIDCHGVHDILPGRDPKSKTHPLNIPDTCSTCHADKKLMSEFDIPTEIVEEYRLSVHGQLLFEQKDTGSPTCATCHSNHSDMPQGFSSVRAVCGKCHQHAAENFATSIHATQEEHKGCVQCHGGGEDRHFHLIERITKPAGIMIQRYAHLLASESSPSVEQITSAIHPDPREIINRTLSTCMDCHDDLEEDESLPKLFLLLDEIAKAEQYYVHTGNRLDQIEQGVLLVDNQRFKFQDAKTHLIALAPLQHTLDNSLVEEKVSELNAVCDEINADLDELENGLRWRYRALIPIWGFSIFFSVLLYMKYKQLEAVYVKPLPKESNL